MHAIVRAAPAGRAAWRSPEPKPSRAERACRSAPPAAGSPTCALLLLLLLRVIILCLLAAIDQHRQRHLLHGCCLQHIRPLGPQVLQRRLLPGDGPAVLGHCGRGAGQGGPGRRRGRFISRAKPRAKRKLWRSSAAASCVAPVHDAAQHSLTHLHRGSACTAIVPPRTCVLVGRHPFLELLQLRLQPLQLFALLPHLPLQLSDLRLHDGRQGGAGACVSVGDGEGVV